MFVGGFKYYFEGYIVSFENIRRELRITVLVSICLDVGRIYEESLLIQCMWFLEVAATLVTKTHMAFAVLS